MLLAAAGIAQGGPAAAAPGAGGGSSSATSPSSPSATANTGESVAGLRRQVLAGSLLAAHGVRPVCPRCDAQVVTTGPDSTTPLSSAQPAGYGPADLAKAFDLPASAGSGRGTIAVIDAGVDATLENDLAVYRKTFGLPACSTASGCLHLVDYTGGAQPAPQTKGAGAYGEELVAEETSLDMDAASAACPSCRLLEISVPWQDYQDDNDVSTGDFATAVDRAVAEHASAVSISYGYSADVTNTGGPIAAAFRRTGIPIAVSTGDDGFNGGVHQSWPSDLPSVTAVGGVTLAAKGGPTAWGSAGSGCESDFRAADGQPSAVTSACGGHRAASDVSADADPATGLAVYDTDAPSSHTPAKWAVIGGTSASAPYIAGLYVRAGRLGAVSGPNTLYRAAAKDFTDITKGDTQSSFSCSDYPGVKPSLCAAGPGWDGLTGIGVPHGLGAF